MTNQYAGDVVKALEVVGATAHPHALFPGSFVYTFKRMHGKAWDGWIKDPQKADSALFIAECKAYLIELGFGQFTTFHYSGRKMMGEVLKESVHCDCNANMPAIHAEGLTEHEAWAQAVIAASLPPITETNSEDTNYERA